MTKKENFIYNALHVVAYIIFVGLCIEAGALIVNFIFSLFKPIVIHNLYQKLDLMDMYLKNKWVFYGSYSLLLTVAILKAYLFYIVIDLMHKIELSKPFSSFLSKKIHQMSYYTFLIGIFSYIGKEFSKNIEKNGYEINKLNDFWSDAQAFILMAAVIYVIAIIFAKGVEMQQENELII